MLNLVLASDNNYVPYLSVCIISILKNNSRDFEKISIYILDDNIHESSKKQLNNMVKDYNCNLEFIKTKNINNITNIPSIKRENTESLTTYARLFISSLIPNIDKALYLDCDAIVIDSLKEVYNTNINNYSCGAVIDTINDQDIVKTAIGMDVEKNYYNAGVLLLNLKYWRKNNIEIKLINYLIENKNIISFHDQDIINAVLSDSIKPLHPKYNLLSSFHEVDYKVIKRWENLNNYYNDEILEDAIKNPTYLHFCGPSTFRPWINKNIKYNQIYEEYAQLTPFYKGVFINEDILTQNEIFRNKVFKSKFFKILSRIIPQKVFEKLARKRTETLIKKNN